jgi:hypothetical protein
MTQTTKNIILSTSKEWSNWNNLFISRAEGANIWDLIDPASETTGAFYIRPAPPNISDFEKKRLVRRTRATSSQTPSVASSTTATQSEEYLVEEADLSGSPAKTIQELTANGRSAYATSFATYKDEKADFETQQRNIKDLKEWVTEHVTPHLINTACKPGTRINEWYKSLQEKVGITKEREKGEAKESYKLAIKPLHRPPKDWLAWLAQWEQALQFAQEKGVAQTEECSDWYDDFESAIGHTNTPWLTSWLQTFRISNKEKIALDTLSYRELINDLSQEVRRQPGQGAARRVDKGAFGAQYGKEAADDGFKKGKRKYTGGSQSGCKLCTGKHTLSECWIAFPETAPSWWTVYPNHKERAERVLAEDEQLVAEIEALKKKPRRSTSAAPRGRSKSRGSSRTGSRAPSRAPVAKAEESDDAAGSAAEGKD